MKKLTLLATASLVFWGLQTTLNAETVTFEFDFGSELAATAFHNIEGLATYQDATSGLSISGEAFLNGATAGTDFNFSSAGFGINAAGGGDATSVFDNVNGTETGVFTFSQDVTLTSIGFNAFGASDSITYSISDGGGSFTIVDGDFSGDDVTGIAITISTSQTLTIASEAVGNGVSLEFITVDFTPVPEPSTYAAIAGALALAFVAYRRRRS